MPGQGAGDGDIAAALLLDLGPVFTHLFALVGEQIGHAAQEDLRVE